MATVTAENGKIVIEGIIPTSDKDWTIPKGTVVYTPDNRGYFKIFQEEIWEASERQLFLQQHNKVFATIDLACERARYELMVLDTLDNA